MLAILVRVHHRQGDDLWPAHQVGLKERRLATPSLIGTPRHSLRGGRPHLRLLILKRYTCEYGTDRPAKALHATWVTRTPTKPRVSCSRSCEPIETKANSLS